MASRGQSREQKTQHTLDEGLDVLFRAQIRQELQQRLQLITFRYQAHLAQSALSHHGRVGAGRGLLGMNGWPLDGQELDRRGLVRVAELQFIVNFQPDLVFVAGDRKSPSSANDGRAVGRAQILIAGSAFADADATMSGGDALVVKLQIVARGAADLDLRSGEVQLHGGASPVTDLQDELGRHHHLQAPDKPMGKKNEDLSPPTKRLGSK